MLKKLALTLAICLISMPVIAGEKLVLTQPEEIITLTAYKVEVSKVVINFDESYIDVHYVWLDNAGAPIETVDGFKQVSRYTGKDFTDVFDYKLKSGDEGYSLGLTLRDVLWMAAKVKILKAGNDGVFEKEKKKN